MKIEDIKRIISEGTEEEKVELRNYFAKYGNTPEKEREIHEILVTFLEKLSKEEILSLSGIIGYPVFLRICLKPKIRHKFPLLQDGASLVIIDDNGNVLVQQRSDNGKFGFSGGCQDLGEILSEVANRESLEETGLYVDPSDLHEVCQVSGLSRKNTYPNGDVVVNNTALHVAYLKDAKGALRRDDESKSVEFKPISFLLRQPKELLHEEDFVKIMKSLLDGEEIHLSQPKIDAIDLPPREDKSFEDYLLSLSTEQTLYLAKKMGYGAFLYESIDERIKDIFPHFIDKSILISMTENSVLLEKTKDGYSLPKAEQSVGESFENILEEKYGIDVTSIELFTRVSGPKTYDEKNNAFINGMIYVPTRELKISNPNLEYISLERLNDYLNEEDKMYLEEMIVKREAKKKEFK